MNKSFLKEIEKFCLFDDDFMRKCFEDSPECVELLLQIILEKPDLKVVEMKSQYGIRNLQGHSVQLDVFALDEKGGKYNIEVQRRNAGARPKRARYYGSVMDANSLQKGKDYESLPEMYVIFITEEDVLGYGLPLYRVDRYVEQNRQIFRDEAHIIYVNGRYRDNTPLGRLMHDFSCTGAEDMHYKLLADRVGYLKGTEEGRGEMCEIMERIYTEGKNEGIQKGRREGERKGIQKGRREGERRGEQRGRSDERKSLAQSLLSEGIFSLEKVAELCHLPMGEVERLQGTRQR